MNYVLDDGGRAAAGFTGKCGDCVVRTVAIAAELPYGEVYQALAQVNASTKGRSKSSGKKSARDGVNVRGKAFKDYMAALGWTWTPTMGIGTGCTVHLSEDELPPGRLIVSVSKHYCAVIDHIIHDTHNPSERGTTIYPPHWPSDQLPKGARPVQNGWAYSPKRCVYGFWKKSS